MGFFLRDPRPHLRKIQRKTRETQNSQVDKRGWKLNPSTSFEEKCSAINGAFSLIEFLIVLELKARRLVIFLG